MARIATTCPTCGEVHLAPSAMLVEVALPAVECSFRFRCPTCAEVVRRTCHPTTAEQLTSCGVRLALVTSPAELGEHPEGPPLTYSDLVRCRRLLSDDDAFASELQMLDLGR